MPPIYAPQDAADRPQHAVRDLIQGGDGAYGGDGGRDVGAVHEQVAEDVAEDEDEDRRTRQESGADGDADDACAGRLRQSLFYACLWFVHGARLSTPYKSHVNGTAPCR